MNWGTKIITGLLLFMGFIVTLVIMMIPPHQADSLIEADYYEKGQAFDIDFNQKQAAEKDGMLPAISTARKGLSIRFQKEITYQIELRRLSDSKFDRSFKTDLATKEVFIPANELESGSWLLRIRYQAGEEKYLYQDKILMP
ncbi:MAG: FixH family protein [Daejeonella sp.]|uniref:FixH family protein n=1 Tax=Daejeonella sp. JGW-45 TaxID=3034148 RepID=UPI0023ED91A2|nr:FixH family protein [Daejeonella sp. JGW-45]